MPAVIAGTTAHVVEPSEAGTLQAKLGAPSKPFSRVNMTVPVPQVPLFTLSWDDVKASEKSTEEDAFAVLAGVIEVQSVTNTNASIDPKPVARSYPVRAL